MSKNPKISILVPIFNVEKYLRECLDSIEAQTLKNIEVICIDDGSTDSSPKIIKEYVSRDSRFKVITKKNSGYGDSMNRGLAKASGEYVGIVESDDFAEPTMFSKLYDLAKKFDAEVVKSNYFDYYANISETSPNWDSDLGALYFDKQRRVVEKHNTKFELVRKDEVGRLIDPRRMQHIFYQAPAIWAAIYKRDFLKVHKISFLPTPGASYQDTSFNFKVWSSTRRAAFTSEAFLHYRRDNEASSVNSSSKVFCVADEFHEIEKFLNDNDLVEELGPLAQKAKYGAYIWNLRRLTDGLDKQFLDLMSKEYKLADKNGVLDYTYFNLDERRDLREIMDGPKMFLARQKARAKAKVSVIVPVYNVEKYLGATLDSLLRQTMKDIEIICVSDGPTDSSLDILNEYYKTDPRLLIREQANGGPARARNNGMNFATSNYYMFCDGDDTYQPDMCQKMYQAILTSSSDIAVCGVNMIYDVSASSQFRAGDAEYFRMKYDGKVKITSAVIKSTDVSPCNKIFRAALQRKYKIYFPNGMLYEDAGFYSKFILVAQQAYYLQNEKLYNYVRHGGGIMAATARKTPRAIDHVRVIIDVFQFAKEHDLLKEHADLFAYNLRAYYLAAVKHLPDSYRGRLDDMIDKFLDDNARYLNSIDPGILSEIKKIQPKRSGLKRVGSVAKRVVRKPIKAVLPKVSLSYRAQNYVLDAIKELSNKVDLDRQLTNQRMDVLSEELSEIKKLLENQANKTR